MAKAKPPTAAQRRYWSRLIGLGCIIAGCQQQPGIHHCGTGGGGRKDHDKVLPLCHYHHQGDQGIDAKHNGMCKRVWQERYGTEEELMARANKLLEEV